MNDQTSFDTATRVAAGDDGTTYDRVSITLHWLTAVLVIVLFAMAVTWDYFPRETRQGLESIHVSLGMLLAAVIVLRLAWRWMPGHQVPSAAVGWVKNASKGVHYLLYLLLVAQVALGFGWRWAQGHSVGFFGLFGIPGPYGQLDKATRHLFHDFHEKIGWAIVILAAGHAAAALYHHYALKDRVLGRMLPLARRSERGW